MCLFAHELPSGKAAVLLRGQGAAHAGEQEQQRDVEPVNKGIRERTPWMCGAHGHPKGMAVDHQQQANGLGNVASCGGSSDGKEEKTVKESTTDPESGWFRKGEHKNVFAYSVQTACDKNGWILGYSVNPGNQHDSRTFKSLYDKIKDIGIQTLVADAGYKTPAIAKLLLDDGITPLLPYKRPMTQDGFFKKAEYVYDEYFDCYVCPNDQVLAYHTTNRSGYREYKSCGMICEGCPYLKQCTESRDHVKVVTRHIWEPYMEKCEDIRHTIGMKEMYAQRKETVERLFGTAKENHGFRYTQMIGKARMEMKVGLTFACMNLKKLAKMIARKGKRGAQKCLLLIKYTLFEPKTRKTLLEC